TLRRTWAGPLERPRRRHRRHDVELLRLGYPEHGAGRDRAGGNGVSASAVLGPAPHCSLEYRARRGSAVGGRGLAALADGLLARGGRSYRRAGPRARRRDGRSARLGRALSLPGADQLAPALRPGPRRPAPTLAGPDAGAHGRAVDLRARLER